MKYILPKSMKWRDNPENPRLEALTFIHGVPQYVPINNAFYEQKGSEIMRLLTSGQYGGRADGDDGDDLVDLRHQAITHGGLLSAELRRHAWPAMLNVDPQQLSKTETQDVESWKKHRDYDQVMKDVLRASVYFPPGLRNQVKRKLQRQLEEVIMRVLMKHPDLYYYQGFDHICLTFLLVVEKDLAVALAEKTAQRYLRLFMGESLQDTKQLLNCLTLLLHKANPQLLRYLQGGRFESAHCISWLLTWFSYVLDDAAVVCRFFDFFLACHPLMTIYVSAAAIVQREKELLDTQQDEGEMFMAVSKVPDNLCLESVLSLIGDLYVQCPPSLLLTEALQGPPPTSLVSLQQCSSDAPTPRCRERAERDHLPGRKRDLPASSPQPPAEAQEASPPR